MNKDMAIRIINQLTNGNCRFFREQTAMLNNKELLEFLLIAFREEHELGFDTILVNILEGMRE